MDNGMENMLDMYLFETNTLIEQLDEILLNAEQVGDFSTENINEIFRIMHTIKGSSAMMQFSSLMTVSHRVEDMFFFIRENGVDSDYKTDLFDLMFQSVDFLKSQVEKIENNQPLDSNIDSFVDKINIFLEIIRDPANKTEKLAQEQKKVDDDAAFNNGDFAYAITIFFDEGCGMENLRSFMLTNSLKEIIDDFAFNPPNIETDSSTSNIIIEKGFAIHLHNQADVDIAVSLIKNSLNILSYEVTEFQPLAQASQEVLVTQAEPTPTPEQQVALASDQPPVATASAIAKADVPVAANVPAVTASNKQSLISVNLTKLDKLMNIVGEIVITESMVTSSPEIQGFKLDNFIKSARQLRKLTDELQDIVMSIRMVPVSGVFHKMNRIVRDMGQKLNKNVKLVTIGEDTEVDKTIVDGISDPIMHLVRNAMDHGIESSEQERIAYDKNPQGKITLSARHTGSEVIIAISDDGKGIDPDVILTKAKTNGILTKPESEYTKKEILALLMAPGFSTKEKVTEFSGRGVGMDVVKKNIEKVGGIVTMTSEFHKGSEITFKIPLTLAIVDGMEIAVGSSIFTVPINNIRQSFKITNDEVIYNADRGEMVKRMDKFYPIIRIHELYNIDTKITDIENGILIWVETSDQSYCLFVDELLGEQQVVVKPLPTYLNSFNVKDSGIAGCTILGDGNISIILDIANLYHGVNNE